WFNNNCDEEMESGTTMDEDKDTRKECYEATGGDKDHSLSKTMDGFELPGDIRLNGEDNLFDENVYTRGYEYSTVGDYCSDESLQTDDMVSEDNQHEKESDC
ncbi:unnamed protein product, partial [Ilex paraguariensis]